MKVFLINTESPFQAYLFFFPFHASNFIQLGERPLIFLEVNVY